MRRRDALRANVTAWSFALLVAGEGCKPSSVDHHEHPLQAAMLVPGNVDAKPSEKNFVSAALVAATPAPGPCREGMVSIEGRFCIDRYEGSLVEVLPGGGEQPFSPYATIGGRHVRALSAPHVTPQAYISATQAAEACSAAGKRLCRVDEWQQACRGPENRRYGYGERREPGRCNDSGLSPVVKLHGFRFDGSTMNDPQLNQVAGTLSKTGEHEGCSNGYGVYDMVGNLHEWVAGKGAFYGGYYLDVSSVGHGDGCGYHTTAHSVRYHDYSTGFRCCSDVDGASPSSASVKPRTKAPIVTKRGGKHR